MGYERVLYDRYEIPVIEGYEYLFDEKKPVTDYIFINEPPDGFSIYLEKGVKPFTEHLELYRKGDRTFKLVTVKLADRNIHFICFESNPNRDAVVWYFYIELFDKQGDTHILPGQVRVVLSDGSPPILDGNTPFIKILEQINLNEKEKTQ